MALACSSCKQKQSIERVIIQISGDEYYCERCLHNLLNEERDSIRKKEEKYIYMKEFESSFDLQQYPYKPRSLLDTQNGTVQSLKFSEQNQQHKPQSNLQSRPSQIKNHKSDLMEDINRQQKEAVAEDDELFILKKQLSELQNLIKQSKKQGDVLRDRILMLQKQENCFWENINRFEKRAIKLEQKILMAKFDRAAIDEEMEQLCSNCLLQEIFNIKIEDSTGYVQNIPMGKSPDFSEINWEDMKTALGHLFLAINYLKLKLSYEYVMISSLMLKGSLSKVLLKGQKEPFSLTYTKENQRCFGLIMQALLVEVSRMAEHLLNMGRIDEVQKCRLPYMIDQVNKKISQIFINPSKIVQKVEKAKWSSWTKALRYFLIDFKHLLTIYVISDKHL